ncbi:alpha-keto acid decarboxylase family protein [Telmatocola sphagniphila]|uniref:Alpha-keto acid decarboxylase family protein n=1 Tax=Telmatocola sphagniphila TaxID=1123043 RepID=A0A8E6EVP4_9BACT|nr:thiamine pyrophosphate-binding protein [Telmatocola sphagniphila]QVL33025.1 alpha-keto acid decarboxylase family protein [Telmatocola sphagniphila]
MNLPNPSHPSIDLSPNTISIGKYLLDRLHELGVRHMFGIPGDYILGFFKMVEESPIEMVVTTNELGAGYAADAYARINGIGVACVTYAVGAFSLSNAVASAYAEKSPVVIISGAPSLKAIKRNQLLHHMVGEHDTQQGVFEKLTVANTLLKDPLTAFREIDRVLNACLRHKRPVYIELPQDRVHHVPSYPHTPIHENPVSDEDELRESLAETYTMLMVAKSPVIIAGVELSRFKLADLVLQFAEKNGIPIASTLLSKSVIPERHSHYLGVYQAAMGRQSVTKFVESSDCVLMLGAMLTDMDTGIFTHNLDENRVIFATSEVVRIRYHHYRDILLHEFVKGLLTQPLPKYTRALPSEKNPMSQAWQAEVSQKITVRRVFQKVNSLLNGKFRVIADPGDALFGAADLTVNESADFLGSAFYATLGWAVPAAIGAQTAEPDIRPIILVGDGAFQMTGMELGTTRRSGLSPIVIILNNKGYLTERFILEGKFNDIPNWNYHKLPEVIGSGIGFEIRTEGELDLALDASLKNIDSFSILNVHIEADDYSAGLRRLGEGLAKKL